MDKIARAVRDYAARRFLSLSHGDFPLTRRSHPPDFVAVVNDFNIVINDLNVATWRVLVDHGYPPPEHLDLLSPSFNDPHDAAPRDPREPVAETKDDPAYPADQADLFTDWNK